MHGHSLLEPPAPQVLENGVTIPQHMVSYWLGDQLLGCEELYALRTNGMKPAMVQSTAYFCPRCGDIWGRTVVVHNKDFLQERPEIGEWRVETKACQEHGIGNMLSDEFFYHTVSRDFDMPRDLMVHEFMVRAQALEFQT